MFQNLKNILAAPVFENDEEKSRVAAYLNAILLAGLFLLIILRFTSFSGEKSLSAFLTNSISILIYIMVALIVTMRLGYVKFASFVLVIASWSALAYQARVSGGVLDTAFIGEVLIILLAGLLFDFRMSIAFSILSIAAGWGLAYLQTTNSLQPLIDKPYNVARDFTVIFSIIAVLSTLTINSLRNALERSRSHEKQLEENQVNLEKRVAERTQALELANIKNLEQANRLRTTAEISQTFTGLKNINELLDEIAEQISQALGFYHVGIYLIDANHEYAVLRASNSQGGQALIAQGHRMQVGQAGIVGYVTSTGKPRIALDVNEDTVYQDLSELPGTRSEMTLPLRIRENIIGALDVQSTQTDAFKNEDLDTLSLLAGQIAISIQNARLFDQTRQALAEAQAASLESSRIGWRDLTQQGLIGYRFASGAIENISDKAAGPLVPEKSNRKEAAAAKTTEFESLAIPINIRGEALGLLNIRQPGRTIAWADSEIRLYTSIVDRLSSALENARLVEETNNRAQRDRTITYVTDKLGASTRVEAILRTAAEELSRVITGSEVLIQLQTGNVPTGEADVAAAIS